MKNISIRVVDIIGALIGILCFIIPIVLIAILIKFEDQGPVLFVQKRVGQDGKIFKIYKLRSMVVDSEKYLDSLKDKSDVQGMFKMKNDPRVTRVGRFIRKYSLDECPQFWNVLQGDMSLVGPRPALIEEVAQYSIKEEKRLSVKPGITGLWQVSGRSNVSFDEMINLDLKYINKRGIMFNLYIIGKTLLLMFFSGKNGAY